MKSLFLKSIVSFAIVTIAAPAFAARIVAVHDEWPTSNTGFTNAGVSNATQFSLNLATFLKGSTGAGNFLIYTDSLGLSQSDFQGALTGAGHTVNFSWSSSALPADLSVYDGIFLSGAPGGANAAVLTNYVNSGKGVYVEAGNGYIPSIEANNWNGFLNNFGLAFDNSYNGLQGTFAVAGAHSSLNGVNQLYYDNGNYVRLSGVNPNASLILTDGLGNGLIGVYDSANIAPVPEPATMLLFGSAAAALILRRKKA